MFKAGIFSLIFLLLINFNAIAREQKYLCDLGESYRDKTTFLINAEDLTYKRLYKNKRAEGRLITDRTRFYLDTKDALESSIFLKSFPPSIAKQIFMDVFSLPPVGKKGFVGRLFFDQSLKYFNYELNIDGATSGWGQRREQFTCEVQKSPVASMTNKTQVDGDETIMDRLKALKKLEDAGLISKGEAAAKRKDIPKNL